METVAPSGSFVLVYNSKDITKDITKNLISVSFSDKTEKESDELDITVEDVAGNWKDAWYPQKGDLVTLQYGYKNSGLVTAGTFQVDECGASGPPDVFSIRGLAAGITKEMRTRTSKGYEKQSLRQIAGTIASKHGMTVTGSIDDVTQNRETDLGFLRRISEDYGHVFSVRDNQLVFSQMYELEKGEAVVSIDRTDLKDYDFKDKTSSTFKGAKVKYKEPKTGKVVEATLDSNVNAEGQEITDTTTEDTLEIRAKAENTKQAELQAKAGLYRSNSIQKEGHITVIGNPLLVAGNNIEVTGMGEFSGKYHIISSTHTFDKGAGYTTSIEIKLVGYIDKVKNKSTRVRKPNFHYEVIN